MTEGIVQAKGYVTLATKMLTGEVAKARHEGATWQTIGSALGVSHQAARVKYAPLLRKALETEALAEPESGNGLPADLLVTSGLPTCLLEHDRSPLPPPPFLS